jgi:hypothetical protein
MVARFFLLPKMTSAHRHVQPPTRPRVKVILSEEGWDLLQANQHEKATCFQHDLNTAWNKLTEVTKTIASKHHKSICRVHNELHIGQAQYLSRRKKGNAWNAFCWKKRHTGPPPVRVQANDNNNDNGMTWTTLTICVSTLVACSCSQRALEICEKQSPQVPKALVHRESMLDPRIQRAPGHQGGWCSDDDTRQISNVTQTLKAVEEEVAFENKFHSWHILIS